LQVVVSAVDNLNEQVVVVVVTNDDIGETRGLSVGVHHERASRPGAGAG